MGATVALILFSSLFTHGSFAESETYQNKSKTGSEKNLSREEKAEQLALKYPNLH